MLISAPSHGWGQNGHRIVAQIAEWHLTPTTVMASKKLLDGDKLAEVSTWADEMRSSRDVFWREQASKWHYINVEKWGDVKRRNYPFPYDYDLEVKDIYSAILRCVTVLKDELSSIPDKKLHFRFLVHLIGDIHQPLHVGKAEDRGGNDVMVTFHGRETNLHALWDTYLIESQTLSYVEFADFIDTKDQEVISAYMDSRITDWMKESFDYRKNIYGNEDTELRWDYQYQHMPAVKERLLQAGIRLAGLMNHMFDPLAKPGINALPKDFN